MPELGDEVEIYCRYCKLNLNGVVSAVVEGKIVKVRCKTCGHFQDYQPPRDMKQAREKALKRLMRQKARNPHPSQKASKTTQGTLDQQTALRKLWEAETEEADFRNTKVYDVHRNYEVGDFIAHKHFGLGKVMEIEEGGRMRVLFRSSIEVLEFGRPEDEFEED